MKAYVILEKDFQYNDEIYYCETNGGDAVIAYRDKSKAKAHCNMLNAKKFKREGICLYSYEPDEDIKDIDKFFDLCKKFDICGETDQDVSLEDSDISLEDISFSSLTDEQLVQLYKLVTLKWYEVQEIEVE